jgi:hypothetical protein
LVAHGSAKADRGSPALFATIESYVIKHRLNLTQNDIAFATEAFTLANRASPILKKVLNNP